MQDSDWKKTKEIFLQTLDLPKNERKQFLANQEDFVRTEVSRLLESHEKLNNFIAEPIALEIGLDVNSYLGKTIGNYKILEIIGTGGMGQVFLAEKVGLDKKFALKIIKRGMDTEAVLKRFVRERQILSRLEHPNIATLLDAGSTENDLPYFVMEYIEGETITKFSNAHQLNTKERLEVFQKVCNAVKYAHQNLIIHRDIKPSNILVTAEGIPKLLDFGIAKLLNSEDFENTTTATQARMLTPEYASPEQINGENITTATDVYSLGVVLYELLSGVRPSSVNEAERQRKGETEKNRQTTASLRSRIDAPIPYDLNNIILKSLREEPERRYQTVQEFSEDIRRYLTGLPVTATSDSTYYRFSKFIRRNKIGTAIAAIILLLSGISIWQGIVANQERQKSDKRLVEIRNVAKSLMNETNDSLAKIPGNVVVQKALAEKSVALLDSLATEATNDEVLSAELADAYTKLANIQVWSFREFEKAVENLNKAAIIYQQILQNNPNNIEIRRKVYANQMRQIESLHNTNQREEMFRIATEAVENRLILIRLEPENPSNYANLAAIYGWFGDKYLLFGDQNKAVENYQKGVEIIDQAINKQNDIGTSVSNKAELARLKFIKGWLLNGANEFPKAIENYLETAEIAQDVYKKDPNIEQNFERILACYEKIAVIYENANDYEKAFENYEIAKNWVENGLQNKEMSNREILSDFQCFYTVYLGKLSGKRGKISEADSYFKNGEIACRKNVTQDENNEENIFESLPFFFDIAEYYVLNGEYQRGINHLQELSKKLQIILDENETDLTAAFCLAETLEKLGDLSKTDSAEFYEKSSLIWQKYSLKNSLLPDETEKMNRLQLKLSANLK